MQSMSNCRLARRLAVILYDSIVLIAVLFFAAIPPTLVAGEGITGGGGAVAMQVYLLAIAFAFFGGFWTHGGQTIGMRSWRVRVVLEDGKAIGWRDAWLRFGAAIVSWAALGAGFWWSLFDRERCAWHDRISGTRLVLVPREGAD